MAKLQQKRTHGLAVASLVLGCFFVIPIVGAFLGFVAVVLGIIALVIISKNKDTQKGDGLAIAGIVMGAVGIIIMPIFTLFAAIAIPNLLKAKLAASESAATARVRTISTAIESYAASNKGKYPSNEAQLIETASLSEPCSNKIIQGYKYTLILSPKDYEIIAGPEKCGITGTKVFIISNGEYSEKSCNISTNYK